MSIAQQITSLLEKRILLLDGAMGTMIQKYDLKEEDFRGDLYTEKHILFLERERECFILSQQQQQQQQQQHE